MNYRKAFVRYVWVMIFFCAINTGCGSDENEGTKVIDVDSLSQVTPVEITAFDTVEDVLFSYLGFNTFVKDDGSIILPLLAQSQLIQIQSDGKTLIKKTKKGRGPGELMGFFYIYKNIESNIYVNDSRNQKVVVFDNDLNLISEATIKPESPFRISNYFPSANDYSIIELYNTNPLSEDEDFILRSYNSTTKVFGPELRTSDRVYARIPGQGMQVPYTDKQLVAVANDKEVLYLFNTGTKLIAEVDFKLDTLRTIPVNFYAEELLETEMDSIRQSLISDDSEAFWEPMKKLLPETKTPIEAMVIDWKGRLWLKSNFRSEYDQWFIMNLDGNIEKTVNLPKNSYLTHVSEHHLGIRLKDELFGLYEAVD